MSAALGFQADVGIVIALAEELKVFFEVLNVYGVSEPIDSWRQQLPAGLFLPFHLTTNNSIEKLTCVIAFMNGPGKAPAERITTALITYFKPSIIINVGISGGLKDARLGVAVLADSIDDFSTFGAIVDDGEEKWNLQLGGVHHSPTLSLRTAVGYLEVANPGVFGVFKTAAATARAECLAAAVGAAEADQKYSDLVFKQDEPLGTAGPFASSDFVVKTERFKNWLLKRRDRRFVAADCESAGVAAAVAQAMYDPANVIQHVYIRGISDLADVRKNGVSAVTNAAMRKLAMQTASHLVAVVLYYHILSPPRSLDLVGEYLNAADALKRVRQKKRALKDQLVSYAELHREQKAEGFRDLTGRGKVYWKTVEGKEPLTLQLLESIDPSQPKSCPRQAGEINELRQIKSRLHLKAEVSDEGTFDMLPTAQRTAATAAHQNVDFTKPRPGSSSIRDHHRPSV